LLSRGRGFGAWSEGWWVVAVQGWRVVGRGDEAALGVDLADRFVALLGHPFLAGAGALFGLEAEGVCVFALVDPAGGVEERCRAGGEEVGVFAGAGAEVPAEGPGRLQRPRRDAAVAVPGRVVRLVAFGVDVPGGLGLVVDPAEAVEVPQA